MRATEHLSNGDPTRSTHIYQEEQPVESEYRARWISKAKKLYREVLEYKYKSNNLC